MIKTQSKPTGTCASQLNHHTLGVNTKDQRSSTLKHSREGVPIPRSGEPINTPYVSSQSTISPSPAYVSTIAPSTSFNPLDPSSAIPLIRIPIIPPVYQATGTGFVGVIPAESKGNKPNDKVFKRFVKIHTKELKGYYTGSIAKNPAPERLQLKMHIGYILKQITWSKFLERDGPEVQKILNLLKNSPIFKSVHLTAQKYLDIISVAKSKTKPRVLSSHAFDQCSVAWTEFANWLFEQSITDSTTQKVEDFWDKVNQERFFVTHLSFKREGKKDIDRSCAFGKESSLEATLSFLYHCKNQEIYLVTLDHTVPLYLPHLTILSPKEENYNWVRLTLDNSSRLMGMLSQLFKREKVAFALITNEVDGRRQELYCYNQVPQDWYRGMTLEGSGCDGQFKDFAQIPPKSKYISWQACAADISRQFLSNKVLKSSNLSPRLPHSQSFVPETVSRSFTPINKKTIKEFGARCHTTIIDSSLPLVDGITPFAKSILRKLEKPKNQPRYKHVAIWSCKDTSFYPTLVELSRGNEVSFESFIVNSDFPYFDSIGKTNKLRAEWFRKRYPNGYERNIDLTDTVEREKFEEDLKTNKFADDHIHMAVFSGNQGMIEKIIINEGQTYNIRELLDVYLEMLDLPDYCMTAHDQQMSAINDL